MLKQRNSNGHSAALVSALKKNGKFSTCEITSAVFWNEEGLEKALITISDMRGGILRQKNIDIEKEKTVSGNIAKSPLKSDRRLADMEWDLLTLKARQPLTTVKRVLFLSLVRMCSHRKI